MTDKGAVLNNSRTNTHTQLAGDVGANPWLANGTAKIILNEVTGPNASQLNGYLEVAGDRAQVIVANPAGLSCSGCGVINASRFTLTTGTPMLTGGSLDGYRVNGGAIRVDGAGLDASRADYTDIIARAVQVNAGIWSPALKVITGTNQVSTDPTSPGTSFASQITTISGTGDKPMLALDVSALGGMYGQKIYLVGTESGVGARNAGRIGAQVGELVVTVDGRLENTATGELQSRAGNARVDARGGIINAGLISAARELTVTTPQDVDNRQGTLNAARIDVTANSLSNQGGTITQAGPQAMTLEVGALSNRSGTIGAPDPATDAGIGAQGGSASSSGTPPPLVDNGGSPGGGATDSSGSAPITPVAPLADGVLHIAGLLDNDGGRIRAASGFDVDSDRGLANDGGQLTLHQLTLRGGDLRNQGGTLSIDGAASLHVNAMTNDAGSLTFNGPLTLDAQQLSNRAGTLQQLDAGATTLAVAGTFDNTGGTAHSNASSFAITSGSLVNEHGTINHAGTDGFTLRTGIWQGAGGAVATASAAKFTANTIDHRDATLNATQVDLRAAKLDNRGGTLAASGGAANTLHVTGTFDNGSGGTLTSNGDLTIQANVFGNAGGTVHHAGAGALAVNAATLNGAGGVIGSNGALTIQGNTTDLSGGTTAAQRIVISTGTLSTAHGELNVTSDHPLQLTVRDSYDNTHGKVMTNGALQLSAGTLVNTDGTLSAAGTDTSRIAVAGTLDNTRGLLAGSGALAVDASTLINRDTRPADDNAAASLGMVADQLTVQANRIDNANGQIGASDTVALTVTGLDNTGGAVTATKALIIDATTLNGAGGKLATNGTLTLTGATTDLRGGTTSAQSVSITTGSLSTAGGHLNALGSSDAKLGPSWGPLQLTVRDAFDNTGGNIVSNGALVLSAGSFRNVDGKLTAAGGASTSVQVAGAFDNTRGTVASAGATTLHAGSLINASGTVSQTGTSFASQASSTAPLQLTVDGLLTNDQGTLQSNGDIELTADRVSNHGGTVKTPGAIHATVVNALDTTGGALIAGGDLAVQAGTLLNRDTRSSDAAAPTTGLYGQQVTLNTGTLDNMQGQVVARDALTVIGTTLSNAGGVLDGQGAVTVAGTTLDNTGGQLTQHGESGSLAITVAQALTNTVRGMIGAEGTAAMHVGSLDNSGGTLSAMHGVALISDTDVVNRDGGVVRAGQRDANGLAIADLDLRAAGTLDNTGGSIDATGAAMINAAAISNVGGQLLAGDASTSDATLQISTVGALNNAGGTIGDRGGDLALQAANIDNSAGGRLVAQRDLTLNTVALNNVGGTSFATRNLSFQDTHGTLDNTGGQFGAGDTATLNLAQVTNSSGGHIQADTLWLTTPTLTNDGGEVDGTIVHATLASLNGLGRLHGAQELDTHITGDYTHLAGQRLESDGVLSLNVDGTLTNQGTLQTPGEMDITAAHLINTNGAVINASADDGSGVAHLVVSGFLDNQQGATLEGDTLTISAEVVSNAGDITGDTIRVDAATLTNGRDLGAALAPVDYNEGLIGASRTLDLHVDHLMNLDATLYSGGDLTVTGLADRTAATALDNLSGKIQAQGNLSIDAVQITNARRIFDTAWVSLTPAEQAQATLTTRVNVAGIDDADMRSFCDAYYQRGNRGCIGDTLDLARGYMDITDTAVMRSIITATSVQGQILSGGDMHLTGAVLNDKSAIAAGANLTVYDPTTGGDSVRNIAWTPEVLINEIRNGQVYTEHKNSSNDYVPDGTRTYLDTTNTPTSQVLTQDQAQALFPGLPRVEGADTRLTAGGELIVVGGSIVNGTGSTDGIDPKSLAGPGRTTWDDVRQARAGRAGAVDGVQGTRVNGGGTAQGASSQVVGSADQPLPGYTPPHNAMVQQHTDPSAPFLITTAPRFAKGPSTSSDYLLRSLGTDPGNIHKRLGDGYYEQNLILDQILQLTGRRTLNGGDGLAQYQSLMDGAAAEAGRLGLSLGAPLTSAQIGALSSDIVWLVDQVVDGQHVLVPVVYLSKATADRLKTDGALIAGGIVAIQSTGAVRNDGTISGTKGTWLSADTLINTGAMKSGGTLAIATRNDTVNIGTLRGEAVSVQAGRDLINQGAVTSTGGMALTAGRDLITKAAPIHAGGNLAMLAGRDLTATASTLHAGGDAQLMAGHNLTLNATERTTTTTATATTLARDTTHSVSSVNAGGNLVLVAGNDLTSHGAQLQAGQQLGLAAGHDLTLNAVTDHQSTQQIDRDGGDKRIASTADDTVRGTVVSGANGISATAGHDLTATAATITSDHGQVALGAGHDLTFATAQENHTSTVDTRTSGGGALSSSTTHTHDSISDSLAIGTTVSGNSVAMAAGNNLTATAAQIVADHDIVMAAGNNLTLNTANDVHTEEHSTSKTKSGLMGAGVGVMVGTAQQDQTATLTQATPTGTTVGSLGGSVTMTAGNTIHLTNASVLSDTGTAIVGKSVTIDAALGTTDTTQTQKQSSSGLTLSLGGAAVSAAQGVYASAKRGGEVKDDRLKALYAAQAAYGVSDAYDAVQKGGISQNGTDGGINLQLGIGASSASSKTATHDETAYGSTIKSHGNVIIAATDGDLNVIGSTIEGNNVGLMASNNINLLSQAEDHSLKSSNKNASGGVGVQIGTDGVGFYAQASVGKGSAHGNGTTHATTAINAKDTLTLISGGDTTIQGAQAKGNTVLADIGGNLNIRSEQDTDDYASKQQQASGKVVVGYGASASGSYNQSNVESHYASVTTVSGIGAGEGGFNIHVKGNTDLKGGVIASTADASKNRLDTGSLTFSNIENTTSYDASSFGVGYGSGASGSVAGQSPAGLSGSVGIPQNGDDHSTTKAGIANGTVIVRDGNADLSALDRNPDIDAKGLKPIFDTQKVQDNQELGQVAGYVGMRTVGGLSEYMAKHATTEADKNAWQDGGANKAILHGVVGAATAALGGGNAVGSLAGAAASEAASGAMQDYLIKHDIKPGSAEYNTMMQLGSAAIGSVGGGAGAATALQGDSFNRKLHPTEVQKIKQVAEKFAEEQGITVEQAEARLTARAQSDVDATFAQNHAGMDEAAEIFLRQNASTFSDGQGNTMVMFTPGSTANYNNADMYADTWQKYPQEYANAMNAAGNRQALGWTDTLGPTAATIGNGTGKGLINFVPDTVNSLLVAVQKIADPSATNFWQMPQYLGYSNEVEAGVAHDVQNVANVLLVYAGIKPSEFNVPGTAATKYDAATTSARFQGDAPYWGVDKLQNTSLSQGSYVVQLTHAADGQPVGSYFMTLDSFENTRLTSGAYDANALNQGLQTYPGQRPNFRPYAQVYELTSDVPMGGAATGPTTANPYFNPGQYKALNQLYIISDFQTLLKPAQLFELSNTKTPSYLPMNEVTNNMLRTDTQ